MSGCFGHVERVLVGLHRVGLVGLRDALATVAAEGVIEREAVVDRLLGILAADNYLPEPPSPDLRLALWREFERFRGRPVAHLYPEVDVELRGPRGPRGDRLVALLTDVLAEFELRPSVHWTPPAPDQRDLVLVARDEVVTEGLPSRVRLKAALRKIVSDW
jgi:hypothetical protein